MAATAVVLEHNRGMYIVAIGWLYVVVLMAFTETSVAAGVATLFFYGLAPVALLLYLMGTPQRRRNRQRREAAASALAQPEARGGRVDGKQDGG